MKNQQPTGSTCASVAPLLAKLVGQHPLNQQETQTLQAHLETCAACRAELESYRQLDKTLARSFAPPESDPLSIAEIHAIIEQTPAPDGRIVAVPLKAASKRPVRPRPLPPERPKRRSVVLLEVLGGLAAVLVIASVAIALFLSHQPASTGQQVATPQHIATPTVDTSRLTPTSLPVECNGPFSSDYQTTLPDSTYPETTVYAQIPLPPQTRSFDNDAAGGVRGRQMCSAGTAASVLAFMSEHLTQQSWQQADSSDIASCRGNPNYQQQQCWQNGSFDLFIGLNSATDWVIVYTDPAFLCSSQFGSDYQTTLPDSTYPETTVYAQVQLPPQTRSYDDDATGHRFRVMCSVTTEDVLTFMDTHLTVQGWAAITCPGDPYPNYSQQRCWQNGKYQLTINFNSNLDWVVEYLDPAFIQ